MDRADETAHFIGLPTVSERSVIAIGIAQYGEISQVWGAVKSSDHSSIALSGSGASVWGVLRCICYVWHICFVSAVLHHYHIGGAVTPSPRNDRSMILQKNFCILELQVCSTARCLWNYTASQLLLLVNQSRFVMAPVGACYLPASTCYLSSMRQGFHTLDSIQDQVVIKKSRFNECEECWS